MVEPKRTGRGTKKTGVGGRPRAADVEKLSESILAAAAELFVQHGFDGTSMDAVAAKARISKRTLYSRHADKSALFNAAVFELLGRFLVPVESIAYDAADLGSALLAIGRDMVSGVVRPKFVAIYRLVIFEAQRRPEFGRWINEARRRPALQTIAALLHRHRDELRLTDPEAAAELFMSLTVDANLRLAAFGFKATPREIEDRLKAAVDLFLNGACGPLR
jgi:TetR/AcrR family transcriptional regulator, mexJK operon transcriptional repressor